MYPQSPELGLVTPSALRHPLSRSAPDGPIVIAYHRTERNPGRYLEAALWRSEAVVLQTESLDWARVDPSTAAVVFVESPLPEISVLGRNPGVPVFFWVHHGEHHLDVNLRLQVRYGADVILLAHSWHLADRFRGRVERFPFAVAPEVTADPIPWSERQWDVGFVGSLTQGTHDRRIGLLEDLKSALGPDRVMVAQGVTPEEQSRLYANSRIVINDGGTRHQPITMRVFEALGAGALLLTDPAPGLDELMTPGVHYAEIEDPIGKQAIDLLHGGGELIARAGWEEARRRHTYDHRLQDLFGLLEQTKGYRANLPRRKRPKGLAGLVDDIVDLQRVLVHGDPTTAKRLTDRKVWRSPPALERATPGNFDAVVINATADSETLDRLIRAARKSVVIGPRAPRETRERITQLHAGSRFVDHPEGTLATFGTTGYRLPSSHPAFSAAFGVTNSG